MFVAFWLQGLAILHWLYAAGHLPAQGSRIIAVYVLMPFLSVILVMSLASGRVHRRLVPAAPGQNRQRNREKTATVFAAKQG